MLLDLIEVVLRMICRSHSWIIVAGIRMLMILLMLLRWDKVALLGRFWLSERDAAGISHSSYSCRRNRIP